MKLLNTEIKEINSQNLIYENSQDSTEKCFKELSNYIKHEKPQCLINSPRYEHDYSSLNINLPKNSKSKLKVLKILVDKEKDIECTFQTMITSSVKKMNNDEFYNSQMKTTDRNKQTIYEFKRKEEDKINQIAAFTPKSLQRIE